MPHTCGTDAEPKKRPRRIFFMMLFSWTQLLGFCWRFLWRRPNFLENIPKYFGGKSYFWCRLIFLETLEIPGVLAVHSCWFNDSDGILLLKGVRIFFVLF